MSDFTIEQLEALKEYTTPGPWITHAGSFGRIESVGPIEPGFSGNGLECTEEDADLAAAAPELVDALITEKRAHQKLRARIGRLRDWHNERGELMLNLYEESLDRQFKDNSDFHSFTANQLSAMLDPRDEEHEADNG